MVYYAMTAAETASSKAKSYFDTVSEPILAAK